MGKLGRETAAFRAVREMVVTSIQVAGVEHTKFDHKEV